MIIWSVISLLIILGDQIVKYFVVSSVSMSESISAIPGVLEFVYVKNTGAAFNILNGRVPLLSIISVVFCIAVLVYWIKKKPAHTLVRASLALLFAGALGNAIDRLARGFVVDFIKLSFVNFPVFNLADIAITVGAALMVIYVIFFDKDEK